MAKYHDLIRELQADISRANALHDAYPKQCAQAASAWEKAIDPLMGSAQLIADADQLFRRADEAYHRWVGALQEIAREVEAAYWDVPFAAPRQQGIRRFYELAGLMR